MSWSGVSRQQSTGAGIIAVVHEQRISEADIAQTTAPRPGKKRSWGPLECCVLAVVVAVNATLASWAPLFIAPDGLDYLNGAYTLAHGGGLADFVSYKAPGLTVVLGLAMAATSHWAMLLHWLHVLLLVAAAGLTWLTARRILGVGLQARIFGAGGALLVGIHPVLLTYQGYLLREGTSTFLIPLAGWLIVRHFQDCSRGRRALVSAATLGAVCGLGALYRENFQTLLVLGPLLVAWAGFRAHTPKASAWKPAIAQGAAAALALAVVMSPWLLWMHSHYGCWSVTTAKTQFNRAINAWENGLIEGSELPGLERGSSSYDYVGRALILIGIAEQTPGESTIDVVIDALAHRPNEASDLCASLLHTAIVRRPWHAAKDAAKAAVSLSGLWNIKDAAAHSNAYLAAPLRGQSPYVTNYAFDVDSLLAHSRFTPQRARFDEMLAQSRVSAEPWTASWGAKAFNEWFMAVERGRPILAVLFIFGCVMVVRTRNVAAGALALLVVINVLGAAILMMTVVDRFAAPMLPLMILIAVYGLHTAIAGIWPKKTGAAEAAPV
jgi:hypothetical protein